MSMLRVESLGKTETGAVFSLSANGRDGSESRLWLSDGLKWVWAWALRQHYRVYRKGAVMENVMNWNCVQLWTDLAYFYMRLFKPEIACCEGMKDIYRCVMILFTRVQWPVADKVQNIFFLRSVIPWGSIGMLQCRCHEHDVRLRDDCDCNCFLFLSSFVCTHYPTTCLPFSCKSLPSCMHL